MKTRVEIKRLDILKAMYPNYCDSDEWKASLVKNSNKDLEDEEIALGDVGEIEDMGPEEEVAME